LLCKRFEKNEKGYNTMRSKKRSKKAGRGSLSNAFINIVGRNMLQNELLLSFLKKETGLKGACFPKLESIPAFDAKEPVISQLFILDCQDVDMKNLWTSIHKMDNPKPSQYFFALCNIPVKILRMSLTSVCIPSIPIFTISIKR